MEDIALSTAAFCTRVLTVPQHRSLPEPEMLDHDQSRDPNFLIGALAPIGVVVNC
jgi:hypothetical protein